MGYTHYWDHFVQPDDMANMKKAIPIIQDILSRYKEVIQFENDDDSPPICNEGYIRFNGIEEDGNETFLFKFGECAFCKTDRKDYDIVVCECLIVLSHFIEQFTVTSDGMYGDLPEGDWKNALDNIEEHYKIKAKTVPVKIGIRGQKCWRFEKNG